MFPLAAAVVAAGASVYYNKQCEVPKFICKETRLSNYLKEFCPILREKYYPTPALMNNHISTCFTSLFASNPKLPYVKENITCADGGVLTLDWLENFNSKAKVDDVRPVLIVLHGLTGSSEAYYIKDIVLAAYRKGMHVVVMNNRGSPGSPPLKTPRTFSAAFTDDLRLVVQHLQTKSPRAPLFALGVSLGSIILSKYLAECGAESPIKAAMAVSNPWNLHMSTASLERFVSRVLYNRVLTNSLQAIVTRNQAVFEHHPDVSLERVLKARTIRQFDEAFIVPLFGYSCVQEYYDDASTSLRVKDIKTPMLFLNAADDPFAPVEGIPVDIIQESDHVMVVLTKRGGHVAFCEGLLPYTDSLMDRIVTQFFGAMMLGVGLAPHAAALASGLDKPPSTLDLEAKKDK